MDTKVAVVILNWNGKKLLEEYLPSVVSSIPSYAKVYLADNNSSDESIDYTQQNFPTIEIIRNKKNYGFAEGYNQALQSVEEDYYVLLNSDIECAPNWIEPIYEKMESDSSIGICQPKILDYKNKTHFEYAGAAGGFIDVFGYPFCRGRLFNHIEKDEQQYKEDLKIFWATGACLFIRKSLFKELNGFDESFFAHMEEIDLCWRAQRTGATVYCVPTSTVYHLGGGTLNKINPKKTYLNFRNNLVMLLKNGHTRYFLIRLVLKLLLDGMAGIKFLLEGSPKHTWSVIRAHLYVYLKLRTILKKRRALRLKYGFLSIDTIYYKSIVASYYLLAKKTFNSLKF